MDKRGFLRTAGLGSLGLLLADPLWARALRQDPAELARADGFWDAIRRQYVLTPDYINLENGYFLMQAQPVLEAYVQRARALNLEASHYMRTRMPADELAVRSRLAVLAGCALEELVVTRNTTESLDTVISGFDWHAGDEAVMAEQDYGSMKDMFRLQARRHGVVNRVVSLPLDPRSDDEIVGIYERALSPRTRLLMVTHMLNSAGQILPVAKVCEMARRHGVPVLVDGAHTFGQIDFRIPDLGCEYFGSSLHKWLGAPLGAGILYVRRDRVASLWPMFADETMADDDIRKLGHKGTYPVHGHLAIADALDFHERIGTARKEARLRHLQTYWTSRVRGRARVVVNTPSDPRRSCAIGNVGVEGLEPAELARTLMERFRIWTVSIDAAGIRGVRVTPHLFTTTDELDALVRALEALSA